MWKSDNSRLVQSRIGFIFVGQVVKKWLCCSLFAIVVVEGLRSISGLIGYPNGEMGGVTLLFARFFSSDIWHYVQTLVLMVSEMFMVDQLRKGLVTARKTSYLGVTVFLTLLGLVWSVDLISGNQSASASYFDPVTPSKWEAFRSSFLAVASNVQIFVQLILGVWLSIAGASKLRVYGVVLFLMPLLGSLVNFGLQELFLNSMIPSAFLSGVNWSFSVFLFVIEIMPWCFLYRCFVLKDK